MPPWKPGQSGNPKGRPKGCFKFESQLLEVLEGDSLGGEQTPDGRTVGEWLIDAMIRQAMKGNSPYMKEIVERVSGKVATPAPLKPVEPDEIAETDADSIDEGSAARVLRAAAGDEGPLDDEIIDVDSEEPAGS